jgi:hypothetical protein
MRSRLMLGTVALTSCFAVQTVVVSPRPVVRSDSLSRAAVATSAMALLEQVAREDSLEPSDSAVGYQHWTECFWNQKSRLRLCGRMEDSLVRIQFTQGGRFYGRGDEVRREVIQKLRSEFGEERVRECKYNWRGRETCSRLAQVDSGA